MQKQNIKTWLVNLQVLVDEYLLVCKTAMCTAFIMLIISYLEAH